MADSRLKHPNAMSNTNPIVELTATELHGSGAAFCPNPKMPLWSGHPRVYIDVATTGEGKCPYCGTVYRLKAGEKVHAH